MLTYTASSASNGTWGASSSCAGTILGPFTTAPFNGVTATPAATNGQGKQGCAAVSKFTVPAPPGGGYKAGSTIQVHDAWTSGSSAWVYLLTSTGALVTGSTNPVQVNLGTTENTTFSITTSSTGTVYYIAVAPLAGLRYPTRTSRRMRSVRLMNDPWMVLMLKSTRWPRHAGTATISSSGGCELVRRSRRTANRRTRRAPSIPTHSAAPARH